MKLMTNNVRCTFNLQALKMAYDAKALAIKVASKPAKPDASVARRLDIDA